MGRRVAAPGLSLRLSIRRGCSIEDCGSKDCCDSLRRSNTARLSYRNASQPEQVNSDRDAKVCQSSSIRQAPLCCYHSTCCFQQEARDKESDQPGAGCGDSGGTEEGLSGCGLCVESQECVGADGGYHSVGAVYGCSCESGYAEA